MKTFKKTSRILIVASMFINAGAYSQHENHPSMGNMQHSTSNKGVAPVEFQKQLSYVFENYINLKEAFVNENENEIKQEAKNVENYLNKVKMELLSASYHNEWMKQFKTIKNNLRDIKESNNIKEQRYAFARLSEALYNSIKTFGLSGMKAYYQYCPMALDNKGAYWLNNKEIIRNPYMGKKMLKCGSVKDEL